MPGADILLAWVDDETNEVVIQDRYAEAKAMPSLDDCPNWLSDGGFQNATHTVVGASRLRVSGDQSDRNIVSGPMKVIWAHNQDGSDTFAYHGSMRHATSVEFFKNTTIDADEAIDPTWKHVDILQQNFTVPQKETVYACTSFNLTQDKDMHIVRIEPILDPLTSGMVHHFLLHYCEVPGVWNNYVSTSSCVSPLAPFNTNCTAPIFGWGVGGNALSLPPEAGYRIGPSGDVMRYFILEVHYNSPVPSLPTFRTDNSGVRVYYTDKLRQHDAAMMVLGDPFVTTRSIPKQTMTHLEISCSSECTSAWSHPLNVFADFLHMHSLGSRMWSTIHRKATGLMEPFHRIDYYDYNFQELGALRPTVTLNPGDRIQTHCVYDSSNRTGVTKFGESSDEEMCMEFIAYYPLVKDPISGTAWGVCGYADGEQLLAGAGSQYAAFQKNLTACGSLQQTSLFSRIVGIDYSTNADPTGGENTLFGEANPNGECPDPLTGRMVVAPVSRPAETPSSVDNTLIIWASVIGGLVVLIIIAGVIFNISQKTALKPKRIDAPA